MYMFNGDWEIWVLVVCYHTVSIAQDALECSQFQETDSVCFGSGQPLLAFTARTFLGGLETKMGGVCEV